MQQADVRIDPLDHFTVQLQHQAQNAVRGRVLRPEVDVELADRNLARHRRLGQVTALFDGAFGQLGRDVCVILRHGYLVAFSSPGRV